MLMPSFIPEEKFNVSQNAEEIILKSVYSHLVNEDLNSALKLLKYAENINIYAELSFDTKKESFMFFCFNNLKGAIFIDFLKATSYSEQEMRRHGLYEDEIAKISNVLLEKYNTKAFIEWYELNKFTIKNEIYEKKFWNRFFDKFDALYVKKKALSVQEYEKIEASKKFKKEFVKLNNKEALNNLMNREHLVRSEPFILDILKEIINENLDFNDVKKIGLIASENLNREFTQEVFDLMLLNNVMTDEYMEECKNKEYFSENGLIIYNKNKLDKQISAIDLKTDNVKKNKI